MYLSRTLASKRALSSVAPGCPAASRSASQLRSLGTARFSSSSVVGRQVGAAVAPIAARVTGGLLPSAARGAAKGTVGARSSRLLMRDQQIRSMALFSRGGRVSHQRLKELEKAAAQSPSDANAEVCQSESIIGGVSVDVSNLIGYTTAPTDELLAMLTEVVVIDQAVCSVSL